jgi:DNA modification methylase
MKGFESRIFTGNAEDILSERNITVDYYKSVRCVVTSPPYYRQRSYGVLKSSEIGQEDSSEEFIQNIGNVFRVIRPLLTDDATVFIVIDDTVKDGEKLNIPFRLVEYMKQFGYVYRDLIVWQKMNPMQGRLNGRLYPTYEYILFFSKGKETPFFHPERLSMMRKVNDPVLTNAIYTYHSKKTNRQTDPNEDISYINLIDYESILEGVFVSRRDFILRNQINFEDFQIEPIKPIPYLIQQYENIVRSGNVDEFPTTSEISWAFGYDPEKYCPICYNKYKRHAVRNRNYQVSEKATIFAMCHAKGKAFTNIWKMYSGMVVKGEGHEASFPYSLVYRLIKFASNADDMILDPFMGRGTTGMIAYCMNRNFIGVDLYRKNWEKTCKNLEDLESGKIVLDFYDHEIA